MTRLLSLAALAAATLVLTGCGSQSHPQSAAAQSGPQVRAAAVATGSTPAQTYASWGNRQTFEEARASVRAAIAATGGASQHPSTQLAGACERVIVAADRLYVIGDGPGELSRLVPSLASHARSFAGLCVSVTAFPAYYPRGMAKEYAAYLSDADALDAEISHLGGTPAH